ncbi:MAG: CAP domain-containing protein [Bacillota bacterium]
MDYITIVLLGVYFFLSILFFFRPLITVMESLTALILAFLISTLSFGIVLNFLNYLGVRENVYTPSLIFIFLNIIVWAILFTAFSLIVNVGQITRSYKTRFFSFVLAVFFCAIIGGISCLSLRPFIQNKKVFDSLNNCYLCRTVNDLMKRLPTIDGKIFPEPLSVYMPENVEKSIMLSPDFEISELDREQSHLIFDLVNKTRQEASVPELEWSEDLNSVAVLYGQEISKSKIFSHKTSDGRTVKERTEALGIKFDYLGENLAIAPGVVQAYEALLNSQNHYKNIVSPVFNKGAVAVFSLKNGFVMMIQQFSN